MATKSPFTRLGFTLDLTVDDEHTYSIKSPPIEVGAYMVELSGLLAQIERYATEDEVPTELRDRLAALEAPEAMQENEPRALLGDAYEAMAADGMPYEVFKLAAASVTIWVRADRDAAIAFWESGGVPPTNRAARRKKTSSSRST